MLPALELAPETHTPLVASKPHSSSVLHLTRSALRSFSLRTNVHASPAQRHAPGAALALHFGAGPSGFLPHMVGLQGSSKPQSASRVHVAGGFSGALSTRALASGALTSDVALGAGSIAASLGVATLGELGGPAAAVVDALGSLVVARGSAHAWTISPTNAAASAFRT